MFGNGSTRYGISSDGALLLLQPAQQARRHGPVTDCSRVAVQHSGMIYTTDRRASSNIQSDSHNVLTQPNQFHAHCRKDDRNEMYPRAVCALFDVEVTERVAPHARAEWGDIGNSSGLTKRSSSHSYEHQHWETATPASVQLPTPHLLCGSVFIIHNTLCTSTLGKQPHHFNSQFMLCPIFTCTIEI